MKTATIPFDKRIYFMWLQGLEQAPPLVRACHRSWVELNPGWQVVVLTDDNLGDYVTVPDWARAKLNRTQLSDLIRLRLLENCGGVWVDATTLCNWDLDSWLPGVMASGFFAFAWPARGYELSSWFLAAAPAHPLVRETRVSLESYWHRARLEPPSVLREVLRKVLLRLFRVSIGTTQLWMTKPVRDWLRVYPYFAFHYVFAASVRKNPSCGVVWRETVKVSADGPHLVQQYGLENVADDGMRLELAEPTTPMYKLSWKEVRGLAVPDSALSVALQASGFYD